MTTELEEILEKMEKLRKELEELALAKGIEDREVLALSRMLDVLLNRYYEILKHKKEA